MTRVECLYRVSTKGQVDHDDIPMQKIECRKFAEEQGWTVIKELQEKGVSGYKVSANKRDAIQELREDAANHHFDILLVFMFDRLGRRDDETPFVVEWFAKQGIRIFSVKEGEQKFESHTDSLINYIRYWQSEGESKKTSIRIKTRLDQLRSEGLYTGGPVHYGYRAVDKGRLNKKNKPVKDLEVDPEEAEIVKEIFERTVNKGDGSFTIANDLNARGYRTKKGAKFQCVTINRMLTDRQYLGYLITKDVTSPHLPELQIVDEQTFQMAVKIVEQRKKINAEWRNIPRRSNNGMLLGGNLYCGHCGSRMTPSCPGEGAKRNKPEYVCYKGANHRIQCDGQRLYLAERIDAVVIQVTNEIMDMIQVIPKDDAIERQMAEKIQTLSEQLATAKCAAASAAEEQEALEMEVGRCILGQSRFSESLLSRLINEKATERKQLQSKAAALEMEIKSQSTLTANVSTYYDRFMGWSAEFRLADIERKRMIVSQLYSRIEVKRGYEIKLVLDANYRQFLDGKIDYGVGYLIEKTDIRHRKATRQISKMTA